MPAVKASVTFTRYVAESCDEELFLIPPHFRQRM
jgi:hypothetical protein